jgi:2-dehydropantoate 2-reductase
MLQDLEAGRPLEIEALVGAILEMGEQTETKAPTVAIVYALTRLLDQCQRPCS